mmetsp:Transcript_9276/g.20565  ORF Transcript_9276/g.20565 Transcript_9276/m.20565 type:complete len:215 (-) Transcript_9276:801-1445(-)
MAAKRASARVEAHKLLSASRGMALDTACVNFGSSKLCFSHRLSTVWKSELCTSFPAQAISFGHKRTASSGELLLSHRSTVRTKAAVGFSSKTSCTKPTLSLASNAGPNKVRLASNSSLLPATITLANIFCNVTMKVLRNSEFEEIHFKALLATCLDASRPMDCPLEPTTSRSTNFLSTLTLFTTMRSTLSPTRYFFQSDVGTESLPSFSHPKFT